MVCAEAVWLAETSAAARRAVAVRSRRVSMVEGTPFLAGSIHDRARGRGREGLRWECRGE